jgi:hypothetical protein
MNEAMLTGPSCRPQSRSQPTLLVARALMDDLIGELLPSPPGAGPALF